MSKVIHSEDARDNLVDALANLAHVMHYEGVDADNIEIALGDEIALAMPTAMLHYRAERDDVTVEP